MFAVIVGLAGLGCTLIGAMVVLAVRGFMAA